MGRSAPDVRGSGNWSCTSQRWRSRALTAALNYYRAVVRDSRRRVLPEPTVIDVPTLVLWGEADPYLGRRLTEGLEEWVRNLRLRAASPAWGTGFRFRPRQKSIATWWLS